MRNFIEFMALLATMAQMGQIIINTDDSRLAYEFEESQKSIRGRFQQQNLTVVLDWRDVDRRLKLLSTCQANTVIDVHNNSSKFQDMLLELSSMKVFENSRANINVFKFYPTQDQDCSNTIQRANTINAKDFIKVIYACYETNSSNSLMLFNKSNQQTFAAKKTASLLDLKPLIGLNCRSSCANMQFSSQFLLEKSKVIEQAPTVPLCTNLTSKEAFNYIKGQIEYETIAGIQMLNCTTLYGDEKGHLFCGYFLESIILPIWFVPFLAYSMLYLAYCDRHQAAAINWHLDSTSRNVIFIVNLSWETTHYLYPRDFLIPVYFMVVIWLPLCKVLVKPRQSTYLVAILSLMSMISQLGLKRFNDTNTYLITLFMVGLVVILLIWFGLEKRQKGFLKALVTSFLWSLAIEGCSIFIYIIMLGFRNNMMKSVLAAVLSRYTVFTFVNYYYKPFD